MQDMAVKVVYPNRMELTLYKRGLDVLENTVNAHGASELPRLMYIIEQMPLKTGSLSDVAAYSPEGKAIVDHYISAYFPS